MNQPKPKRGSAFTNIDTGDTLYLERIKTPLTYLMCDSPGLELTANFKEVNVHSLKPAKKIGKGLVSNSKKLTHAEKSFKAELNVFFANQTLIMPSTCDNCKQPLQAFNSFERRCCMAHILPKSKFKSVAMHPQNLLFICAKAGCHSIWDNSDAEKRSKMNCYPLAIERFEQFKSLLNSKELLQAYTYLGINFK